MLPRSPPSTYPTMEQASFTVNDLRYPDDVEITVPADGDHVVFQRAFYKDIFTRLTPAAPSISCTLRAEESETEPCATSPTTGNGTNGPATNTALSRAHAERTGDDLTQDPASGSEVGGESSLVLRPRAAVPATASGSSHFSRARDVGCRPSKSLSTTAPSSIEQKDGRKADRNGARIARARENQTRDSAR
jgi:hypothetical protein